jgi:hypothetical protein
MNRKRFTRIIMLSATLAVYGAVRSPADLAAGPTDDVAECLVKAYNDAIRCVNILPWYTQLLCNARFHTDVLLCLPKAITRL